MEWDALSNPWISNERSVVCRQSPVGLILLIIACRQPLQLAFTSLNSEVSRSPDLDGLVTLPQSSPPSSWLLPSLSCNTNFFGFCRPPRHFTRPSQGVGGNTAAYSQVLGYISGDLCQCCQLGMSLAVPERYSFVKPVEAPLRSFISRRGNSTFLLSDSPCTPVIHGSFP